MITEIRLSDEGDPNSQKGSNFGSPVDPCLVEDFPGTDSNSHPASPDLKIAYYEVTVRNRDDRSGDRQHGHVAALCTQISFNIRGNLAI